MDTNGTGKVSREGFVQWYAKSEQRIQAQTRTVFNKFDADQSGDIDAVKIKKLLEALGNTPSEKDLSEALIVMGAGKWHLKERKNESEVEERPSLYGVSSCARIFFCAACLRA